MLELISLLNSLCAFANAWLSVSFAFVSPAIADVAASVLIVGAREGRDAAEDSERLVAVAVRKVA